MHAPTKSIILFCFICKYICYIFNHLLHGKTTSLYDDQVVMRRPNRRLFPFVGTYISSILVLFSHYIDCVGGYCYVVIVIPIMADCGGLCKKRCSLHSRPNVCTRACGTCCSRCNCVPPGTSGNREMCGRCYTDMTTHGNKTKCP